MEKLTGRNKITDDLLDTQDLVPYVQFIEYFREKPQWRTAMSDVDSCFMRLLQIDNLFYKKKKVVMELNESFSNVERVHTPVERVHTPSIKSSKSQSQISPMNRSTIYKNSMSESPFNNLDFDRDKSEIRQIGRDGKPIRVQISIDVFALKIFALLFCRGTIKQKSLVLFDVILGPQGVKMQTESLSWKNTRMLRALRLLVYFSEIFPKKYQTNFIDHLFGKMNTNKSYRPSINYLSPTKKSKGGKNRDHVYEEQVQDTSAFADQNKDLKIIKK